MKLEWKNIFRKKSKKNLVEKSQPEEEYIPEETVQEIMNEYNKKLGILRRCSNKEKRRFEVKNYEVEIENRRGWEIKGDSPSQVFGKEG